MNPYQLAKILIDVIHGAAALGPQGSELAAMATKELNKLISDIKAMNASAQAVQGLLRQHQVAAPTGPSIEPTTHEAEPPPTPATH